MTENQLFKIEEDVPYSSGRSGAKLSRFPLADMKVGNSFVIPYEKRVIKGKEHNSPKYGFNLKAANEQFAGKAKFAKKREGTGIRVFRIE